MENRPPEVLSKIYENLSDPVDILSLSISNAYIREVLKKSIRKLNTKDELLYLDIGWLTQYPRLEDVSDEIIFNINASKFINFSIPPKLKRFNIRIFLDNTIDTENYNIIYNIIKSIFEKIIEVGNIYEYTVRIILNYEAGPSNDEASIIDLGNFAKLSNFNRSNKLTYINTPNINYKYMFLSLGTQLIVNPTNIPENTAYFKEIVFNYSLKLSLNDIFYPNQNFSNFFDEIYPILIFKEDEPRYINYWESVKILYKSTGFTSFTTIKHMINKYRFIVHLDVQKSGVINHDDLLNKYLGPADIYSTFIRKSLNYVKDKFKGPNTNISPAHYYITDPLIHAMINF